MRRGQETCRGFTTSLWVSTDYCKHVKILLRVEKEPLERSSMEILRVHIVMEIVCVPLTRVERTLSMGENRQRL